MDTNSTLRQLQSPTGEASIFYSEKVLDGGYRPVNFLKLETWENFLIKAIDSEYRLERVDALRGGDGFQIKLRSTNFVISTEEGKVLSILLRLDEDDFRYLVFKSR